MASSKKMALLFVVGLLAGSLSYTVWHIEILPTLAQHNGLFAGPGVGPADPWTSTTTPSDSITQRIWGRDIKLTGYESLDCLGTDANGLLESGTCGVGGGADFPFTPTSWGVSTSTTVGFTQGFLSNASSTIAASTTITGVLTASGGIYGNLTGTASLATALAANGANCSAGSFPLGVDASGAVETCTDAWTEAENTSAAYFNGLDDFTGTLTDGKICRYDLAGGEIDCDYTDIVGSGGTGIATSGPIADTEIIFATDVGTVDSEAAFTYDDATNRLTVDFASSSVLSVSGSLMVDDWKLGTTTAAVCKDGTACNYTTIQGAIDANWRPITFKQGTFAEQLTFANTKTYLEGDSLMSIVQCNGSSQSPCISTNQKDESFISNLTINEANANPNVGVAIDFSMSSLDRLTFTRINNFATSTKFQDTGSAATSNTFYNLLLGNYFANFGEAGIDLSGSQPNAINSAFNRIRPMQTANGGYGIFIQDTRGFLSVGDDIEGTTTSNGVTAVHFSTSTRDNTFIAPWIEANGNGVVCETGSTNNNFFGGTISSNGTDIDADCIGVTNFIGVNVTGDRLNSLMSLGIATTTSYDAATVAHKFGVTGSSIFDGNVTLDGDDLLLFGSSADITSNSDIDLYPASQSTRSLRVSDGTTLVNLSGTGGSLGIADLIVQTGAGTSTFASSLDTAEEIAADQFFTSDSTATSSFAGLSVANGFRISTLASCDTLDTDAAGNVICGTDAQGAGSSFDYPFPNNATTTLLLFNGNASSTMLSATQFFAGGTATTSISTDGNLTVGGLVKHASNFDIYPQGQLTRGFRIADDGTNIDLSVLGGTQLDINDLVNGTQGFLSTASSTITQFTSVNSTSTNATTTNFGISGSLTFNGVTADTWPEFCSTITGGTDLCDGSDATGAGGGTYPFTPTTWNGFTTSATTSRIWAQNGLMASTSAYFDHATTTSLNISNGSLQFHYFNGEDAETTASLILNSSNLTFDSASNIALNLAGNNLYGVGTGRMDTLQLLQSQASTGGLITAADGVFTLLGEGNGNDENLTIDLDNAAANKISINSGTGATDIDFNSLRLTFPFGSTTALSVSGLTASRAVFTDAASGLTTTGTVGALEAAVGLQNIILETEFDACAELAALLDVETGGCNGTSGPVFPDSPTLSGTLTASAITATGVLNFGGATSLEIPNGASFSITAEGDIYHDTTSDNLLFATSTTGHVVIGGATTTLYAYSATTSPITSGTNQDLPSHFLPQVVTAVWCKVSAATSLVINLSDGTNDTNSITCTTTGAQSPITSNNSFTAYEAIRVEYGTKTGTPGDITLRIMGYRTSD